MSSPHEITDRDLVRYGVELDPPGFVKEAAGDAIFGAEGMVAPLYADPVDRFYPAHTAAATWASHAKFAEAGDRYELGRRRLVADRLGLAARRFGIEGFVEAMAAKRAAAAAAPPPPAAEDHAWVAEDGTGRLPIRDSGEVKRAAEYLAEYRDRLAHADRAMIASRTLAKAAALGVDLGDAVEPLERMAGLGGAPRAVVKAAAALRADAVRARAPEVADDLDRLAAAVGPGWGRGELRQLAGALDEIDRTFGLRDAGVGFPEDALFQVTRSKLAEVAAGVGLATGAVYRRADLATADLEEIREALGDKVAADLSDDGIFLAVDKAAAALPALDRRTAGILEAVLDDQGIRPLARLGAPERARLDRQALLKLAASAG